VLTLPLETIAYRFLATYEWEVSEFSMATYCTMVANGNAPMVGLPVFPSRVFRHGAIFVRDNSPIKTGADLKGKKLAFHNGLRPRSPMCGAGSSTMPACH
jgi:4,5-dihydroxyphthalate decarboxylase